jgi:hypothetical protein
MDIQTVLFRPSRKPPRHQPGQWFLKGPVPWLWLDRAARLPGKALALSLVLWREANRRRQSTVRLCLARVDLGLDKYAARRALKALETAGLVSTLRKPGRGVEVTILDCPAQSPNVTGS